MDSKKSRPHTAPRDVPPALIRLSLPFQHALQHFAPLPGLPDLIGIFVLSEAEKLLVSLQSKLRLVQLIVANRADKPDACAGLFHFGYLIECTQSGRIISSQKKRGAEIFPISEILTVKAQCDTHLLLGSNEFPLLEQDAPQTSVQLRVVRRQSERLLKGGDRIIPLLPGNLYVGTKLERLERGLLAGVLAIEFRESRVVLFLFDEKMDESRAGFGIIGHEIEIIAVSASGFGFFLGVEALRQSSVRFRLLRLNLQRAPESSLGFVRLALMKGHPTQVIDRREIVGIQMEQGLEGLRGTGPITRAVLRDGQEISGPALCRKQFNRIAERYYGSGVFLLVKKEHAKIEISLGHFWVDCDGACVFGASLVSFLERGVDVRKLKMRVSEFRLVSDNLLQRRNGGFEFLLVNAALRFIEQVVERVGDFLRLGSRGRFGFGS